MPLLGTGIVPSGAVGTELTAVTRRAFVPKLIVNVAYNSTPTLSAALANAQTCSGGIASITVPIQGTAMTTAQATDYTGAFSQPSSQTGITAGEYNLRAVVVPIGFQGMEGLVQLDAAVIPLIEARMNDSGSQIADYLSTQLLTNATAASVNIDGFPLIASTTTVYGNIDPASNSWWVAGVRAETTTTPTRNSVLTDIVSAAKTNNGEAPNMGIMGPGTWAQLARDFTSQEQYQITPDKSFDQSTAGARALFTALMVGGVPIYFDLGMTEGQLLLFNTKYASFYIHQAAAFAFTGFASTLPNFQLGYVGALVAVLEFVVVKRKSVTLCTGYSTFQTV